MKRLLILSLVMCAIFNAHSQLVVGSSGNVSIGTEEPSYSQLSIGCQGNSYTRFCLRNNDMTYGLNIDNFLPDDVGSTCGLCINSLYSEGKNCGILSMASSESPEFPSVGVCGTASPSANGAGVYGARYRCNSPANNFAGVFGYSGTNTNPTFSYPGLYAGYFRGNVQSTDTISARKFLSPAASSSSVSSASSFCEEEQRSVIRDLRNIRTLHLLDNSRNVTYSINDEGEEEVEDCLWRTGVKLYCHQVRTLKQKWAQLLTLLKDR